MIRHLVLFRLKRPASDTDKAELLATLEAFAATAPHVADGARVGTPLGLRPESRHTTDALIEMEFATEDDFHAYIASDEHVRLLREELEPRCECWWAVQV